MDLRLMAALSSPPMNVAAFCRSVGCSRETFYKWRRRFLADGLTGLQPRSKAARRHPTATPPDVEDLVVLVRKQLHDEGKYYGPQTIRWELERRAATGRLDPAVVPSVATIARISRRRGQVVPQPQKRPRSATRRFEFAQPNGCWQSDATGWRLAGGRPVGIAATLDDKSRMLVGIGCRAGDANADLTWQVMLEAISRYGVPAASLTDNGTIYTGRFVGSEVDFERNLRKLGVLVLNSRPHHPQTCGKVERFWQTLKRWLDAQPAAKSVDELNAQLAAFAGYYNTERRHRALPGRCTPAQAWQSAERARPAGNPGPGPVRISRHPVDKRGRVAAAGLHLPVGRRWQGHSADIITDGDRLLILIGRYLIRDITLEPGRRHYPLPERQPRGVHEPIDPTAPAAVLHSKASTVTAARRRPSTPSSAAAGDGQHRTPQVTRRQGERP